ncbi:hypothetical protein ACFCV3_41510 [Kribbella sp. NPDC056345]|uniref:hypothetical protein n=1 Tax=Kribbella sp. NPDC056345 TaxID=3345789 RepID=UPI0035DA6D71
MPDDFRAVSLRTPEQYAEAAALYRAVFGYQQPDHGLNPRLLAALAGNGGSVVGVLDAAERLVAFAYGFPGISESALYHYSQSAVVAADLQGRGLGRMLKYAQREVALAHGMTRMRWTYDPFQLRNAHFNLNVLGARGRWYAPDLYGPGTDRLVVEWNLTTEPLRQDPERMQDFGARRDLDPHQDSDARQNSDARQDLDRRPDFEARQESEPCPESDARQEFDRRLDAEPRLGLEPSPGPEPRRDPVACVGIPADRAAVTAAVIARVRDEFAELLAKGLVATGIRRDDEHTASYLFGAAE